MKNIGLETINSKDLKKVNGGSKFGYYCGYYFTKGMTTVKDALEEAEQWVEKNIL